MQKQKEINGFRQGDIVKIKPEFLDEGERDDFHVVKMWHENCLGLTRISKDNLALPFPPITDTGLKYIEPKIYGNVEDDSYTEEFANTPLT